MAYGDRKVMDFCFHLDHVGGDLVPQADHAVQGRRQEVHRGPAVTGQFRLGRVVVGRLRVTGTGHALLGDGPLGRQR